MAIINGPYASKMRGKVGEVVAAKTTGNRTALRSYQPNVKNPNTLRQRVSRNKLAMASALAAVFSEAIKIGFAKAAAGTKMYPRNMFVSDIVPVSSGVFTVSGENVSMDKVKLPFSKASGISVLPKLSQGDPGQGFSEKIVLSNINEFVVGSGESLGLVVVAFNSTTGENIVKTAIAADGVGFTEAELASVDPTHYKGFVKIIPEALNGVPTESIPWKYPSATSATVAVL